MQTYFNAANSSGLSSVALRYINHIEPPYPDVELEDYFRVMPQIPQPIPQIFPAFLLNVDIPYESPVSGLRIIFGTVVPKMQGNFAYVLDLNMYSTNDSLPSNEEVSGWLEIAHERIEIAFDASFTERAHCELFGEVGK